ncbi:PAS domain-containing protein [Niabella insulamsoli]|uniref:PAS domain-containing protein n=1 Tax=Niabella insulamsoli TaxID=3144874 RepID=UPI0031FDAB53
MKPEWNQEVDTALYQLLPLPVLMIDTQGTITFANGAAAILLRMPLKLLTGKSVIALMNSDASSLPEWHRCLQQLMEGASHQKISALSYRCRQHASPRTSYLDIALAPVAGTCGAVSQIVAIITDITEAVLAKRQEARLLALLEKKEKFLYETERTARNGTWEIDMRTQTVVWSDMMREIYEIAPDTELNFETTLAFYKNEQHRKKLLSVVEEAMTQGSMFDVEFQIDTAKGRQLWVRSTGKAELVDGICVRLYGTTQDITEQKKINDAFMASSKRYNSLLQSIEGIVWEARADNFEFSFVSDQAEPILGYTSEEWLKEPSFWSNHIYPDDRERAVAYCTTETRKGRNHSFDYRMIKADGSTAWLKDMVSVITENGAPSVLRGIMVDITESKLSADLDHLEKHILELNAVQNIDIGAVLSEYLKGLEQLFPYMKCSILRVRDNKVYNWAAPSLPASYVNLIDGQEIGPYAGSCGTSAYLKEKVIVSDIETDLRWANYKHLVLPHDLLSCWSYPVLDAKGAIMAVWGIYFGTKRTPAAVEERVIERSTAILGVILENRLSLARIEEFNLFISQGQELANFGTWQWDIKANKVQWSDVLYKIYGVQPHEFSATFEGYLAMLHADDRDKVTDIIQGILETHNDVLFEERIIRPDGEERTLKSWGRLVLDEKNNPIKMIGACLDITQARKTQTRLKEIAWLQSHVIRAPLTRLMGLVNILQNELQQHDIHHELLNHIEIAAHELDDVIKKIDAKTNV